MTVVAKSLLGHPREARVVSTPVSAPLLQQWVCRTPILSSEHSLLLVQSDTLRCHESYISALSLEQLKWDWGYSPMVAQLPGWQSSPGFHPSTTKREKVKAIKTDGV